MTMTIGMMWRDPTPTPLETKIQKAILFYSKKYGGQPDTIYVNPADLEEIKLDGVTIHDTPSVMPNHLWVGEAIRSSRG